MKAFKGTLIVALILMVVGIAVWLLEPRIADPDAESVAQLFNFEKQDLIRAEIDREKGKLVLAEQPDGRWIVEGPGWPAARSMVSRVKHQIHDLTSRATVVENPQAPELYGLGKNAVHITLFFRDGNKAEFLAGDPNPSNVSYYIQVLPSDLIYTVKKSALDYYTLDPQEFRERRFSELDSDDADRIEADLPGGKRLVLQRLDQYQWQMEEPKRFRASREEVRMLLGRVTALKVRDFVEDHPKDLARYGLDNPRARILIKFASREPIDLRIGSAAAPDDGPGEVRTYSHMIRGDEFTVVTARDDLIDDFLDEPEKLRLTKFMRMRIGDITDVVVDLEPFDRDDPSGSCIMHNRADKWLWDDGTPVAGSTPERVALRAAEINADTVISETGADDRKWGFDKPRLRITLTDRHGQTRGLLVGKETSPEQDPEGRERKRYFARASDDPIVYRIDDGVIDVAQDAVREFQRKDDKDAEREERHDRMGKAMGELPQPQAEAVPPRSGRPDLPERRPRGPEREKRKKK